MRTRADTMTYYACAAAYLDTAFRQRVIACYIDEKHRAIAPSPGINIAKLLEHCIRADRIEFLRDTILSCFLILTILSYYIFQPNYSGILTLDKIDKESIILSIAVSSILFNAIRANIFPMWHLRLFSILQNVSCLLFLGYEFFLMIQHGLFHLWTFMIFTSVIVGLVRYTVRHRAIVAIKAQGDGHNIVEHTSFISIGDIPARTDKFQMNIAYATNSQQSNIIVHAGNSPFEFAGMQVNSWSVSIPIDQATKDGGIVPFTENEIIGYVIRSMTELQGLKLRADSKLFINGQDVKDEPEILPNLAGRPVSFVDNSPTSQSNSHTVSDRCRRIIHIRASSWEGELELSSFLEISKIADRYLFIHFSHHYLPVLSDSFRRYVDSVRPHRTLHEVIGSLVSSMAVAPAQMLWGPIGLSLRMIRHVKNLIQKYDDLRRIQRNDPTFEYGALPHARQMIGTYSYRRHGQKIDIDRHVKIVNNSLLDMLVSFLGEKNIDTSVIREERDSIVNYGIIVNSGTVKAQNLIIGKKVSAGAKAALSGREIKQRGLISKKSA